MNVWHICEIGQVMDAKGQTGLQKSDIYPSVLITENCCDLTVESDKINTFFKCSSGFYYCATQ